MRLVARVSARDFVITSASRWVRVQASPEVAPVVYRDLRRRLVERFPYAILYRVYPGIVFVVAIMHAKQSPGVWKRRATRGAPG
jgi:hypothetical protein